MAKQKSQPDPILEVEGTPVEKTPEEIRIEREIEDRERIQEIRHAGQGIPDDMVRYCIMQGIPADKAKELFGSFRANGGARHGAVQWGSMPDDEVSTR